MPLSRHIIHIITVLLITIGIGAQAYALNVNNVRFGVHPDKVRMVIEVNEVTDFRAFTLSSPNRLVVDLPTFSWQSKKIERPESAMISDIRQGKLNKDISRIVFDLQKPTIVKSAFLLPKTKDKPNRIVVDYQHVSTKVFEQKKEVIHGTLTVKTDDRINESTAINTQNTTEAPTPPPNTHRPSQAQKTQPKPLIVIDPGHGGQDPGARANAKLYEKTVVLAIAKELKKQLLQSGKYRVALTREKDVYIRLKDRVKFARDRNADLFISIHADSIHKRKVRGTSIYTISKKASDAQTEKLAEKENQSDLIAGLDLNIEDEQVAFILGDFLINDTMNQSKFFANTVVKTLKSSGIRMLENPHRYAGFAVLKAPEIPSVLIEAGFMSNPQEAKLLNQPNHRKKIAKSIIKGINQYFATNQINQTR